MLPYEVKRVESVFVVDTLDLTHNQDVSVDCACSAEKVYCSIQYVEIHKE